MKLFLAVVVLVFTVSCGLGDPSKGEKIGTLIRVAQSGVFCSTWEATIVRGGLSNGSGGFATEPYHFTLTSDLMAADAVVYMENHQEVRLEYRAEGIYSLCRSDSGGHFALILEPLGGK